LVINKEKEGRILLVIGYKQEKEGRILLVVTNNKKKAKCSIEREKAEQNKTKTRANYI
jgi:hypothetical protein